MFADNDRISERQMGRQIGLAFLGVWLFLLSGFTAAQGREGILGAAAGGLLLGIYAFFLVRLSGSCRHFFHRAGKTGRFLITAVVVIWAVSAGSLLLRVTAEMVSLYLLPGMRPEYISGFIILTAVIGSGEKIQTRARLAEVSFPFVAGAFLILLLTAAFQMKQPPVIETSAFSVKEAARTAYTVFAAGCPLGLLPFLLVQVKRESGAGKVIYRYLGILVLFLTGASLILLGTFGASGLAQRKLPIVNLMAGGNIPGGFLERFDILWMAVLLYSLFFALGSLLFYCGYLTKLSGGQSAVVRWLTAAAVWIISTRNFLGYTILDLFPVLFYRVYVPLFLLMTLLAAVIQRRKIKV